MRLLSAREADDFVLRRCDGPAIGEGIGASLVGEGVSHNGVDLPGLFGYSRRTSRSLPRMRV